MPWSGSTGSQPLNHQGSPKGLPSLTFRFPYPGKSCSLGKFGQWATSAICTFPHNQAVNSVPWGHWSASHKFYLILIPSAWRSHRCKSSVPSDRPHPCPSQATCASDGPAISLRDLVNLPEGLTELENNLFTRLPIYFCNEWTARRAAGFLHSLSPLSSPWKPLKPCPLGVSMEVLLQEGEPACVTLRNELS